MTWMLSPIIAAIVGMGVSFMMCKCTFRLVEGNHRFQFVPHVGRLKIFCGVAGDVALFVAMLEVLFQPLTLHLHCMSVYLPGCAKVRDVFRLEVFQVHEAGCLGEFDERRGVVAVELSLRVAAQEFAEALERGFLNSTTGFCCEEGFVALLDRLELRRWFRQLYFLDAVCSISLSRSLAISSSLVSSATCLGLPSSHQ